MEVAAGHAIAATIGEDELAADYIVPSVFNRDVVPAVASAVAARGRGRRRRAASSASRCRTPVLPKLARQLPQAAPRRRQLLLKRVAALPLAFGQPAGGERDARVVAPLGEPADPLLGDDRILVAAQDVLERSRRLDDARRSAPAAQPAEFGGIADALHANPQLVQLLVGRRLAERAHLGDEAS